MIVRIPSSLKWLITKRDRLLATIKKVEQESVIKKSTLKALVSENRQNEKIYANTIQHSEIYVEALKSDLKAIDATLRIHDIPIDSQLITPLNTQSSYRMFEHGAFTRLIFSCLKCAKSESRTTTEIASFIAHHYGIKVLSEDFIKIRCSGKWKLNDWTAPAKIGRPIKLLAIFSLPC